MGIHIRTEQQEIGNTMNNRTIDSVNIVAICAIAICVLMIVVAAITHTPSPNNEQPQLSNPIPKES
jgi:Mn2+/Fe2+ NRAMP family transporter